MSIPPTIPTFEPSQRAPLSPRPSVIQLAIREKGALHAALKPGSEWPEFREH